MVSTALLTSFVTEPVTPYIEKATSDLSEVSGGNKLKDVVINLRLSDLLTGGFVDCGNGDASKVLATSNEICHGYLASTQWLEHRTSSYLTCNKSISIQFIRSIGANLIKGIRIPN